MSAAAGFPIVAQTVTQETIDAYADLSGDHNPLHVDPEFAARTPFGSTIAHGPIALHTFFVAVTKWLDREDFASATNVRASFRAPVRPGDTVTCRPTRIESEADRVLLEAECRNQHGEVVLAVSADLPAAPASPHA